MINFRKLPNVYATWGCCCLLVRPFATAPGQVRKATKPHLEKKSRQKSQGKKMKPHKRYEEMLRNKLLQDNNGLYSEHIYKKLYPWRTRLALAEHLKSTEVYNQDGLIALCKPYGVAQAKTGGGENWVGVQNLDDGGRSILPDDLPGVADALPDLCRMYGEPNLQVIKSTERWSSGLIFLSTSPKVTESVRKCWKRSKAAQQAPFSYWAVTVGLPKPASCAKKTAVTLEYVKNVGKLPVITKKYSVAKQKKHEVKLSVVEHQALVYNQDTQSALVQVNTQLLKFHFLRLWLAHSYSPALGDNLFSGRVRTVSDTRVHISPHNIATYEPQVLPNSLYSKLELPPRKVELIPCHLHLAKVELIMFDKKKSNLTITAPPPEHFMWTCKQLGLMSDEDGTGKDNELRLDNKEARETPYIL